MIQFPTRNLPDEAVPWARAVEKAANDQDALINGAGQSLQNSQRAFSGQLSTLSNQVNDLADRQIFSIPVPEFSATEGSPANVSVTLQVPSPRTAIILFNSEFSRTSGVSGNGFLRLSANGQSFALTSGFTTASAPEGFPDGAVSMGFAATLPGGTNTLSVNLTVLAFTPDFVLASVNPTFSVYLGNPV